MNGWLLDALARQRAAQFQREAYDARRAARPMYLGRVLRQRAAHALANVGGACYKLSHVLADR